MDKTDSKSIAEKRLERKKRKKLLKVKKSRIILRNLSFKANESIIREKFKKFGNICEVNIVTKADGRKFGFAFVGFDAIKSALKAIKEMNGTDLLGRTIAVDFALAKKRFISADKEEEDSLPTEDIGSGKETIEVNEEQMERDVTEDTEDTEEKELNDDESDDGSDDNQKWSETDRKIDPKILNDASEERTVFVRNLSFVSSAESLNELMRRFGPTEYCRLCVDPMTEHSKGTAFVKFKTKTGAQKCLESAETENNSDLYLDGRQLNVSIAVTRSKLKDLQENRLIKDKDKRNLYLAKEGLIYPDSPAAEGVSQQDLAKRLALETKKRKMLQNNHYFVSQTRLCIHNLPLNYDNKKLRPLFMNAVNDKKTQIIECRVMFDRKADQKFGKSKGFGFVEFSQHSHALKALRYLNNNPNVFVPQKRPIVEFSIENKVALNKKKHRIRANQKSNERQTEEQNNKADEEPAGDTVDYSGVISRPNKPNEKIKAPKVNRKLGEMKKQLKSRGKKVKKIKNKNINEKRHEMKVENRKQNKKELIETQDSHDLHYKKRKNIFKADNSNKAVPKTKKVKWFTE